MSALKFIAANEYLLIENANYLDPNTIYGFILQYFSRFCKILKLLSSGDLGELWIYIGSVLRESKP